VSSCISLVVEVHIPIFPLLSLATLTSEHAVILTITLKDERKSFFFHIFFSIVIEFHLEIVFLACEIRDFLFQMFELPDDYFRIAILCENGRWCHLLRRVTYNFLGLCHIRFLDPVSQTPFDHTISETWPPVEVFLYFTYMYIGAYKEGS
jgi:hypothetical protein